MSFIKQEKSIYGSILSLSRQLTLDDFDIQELDKISKTLIEAGFSASLKKEVIDELTSLTCPKEHRESLEHHSQINRLCFNRNPRELVLFPATIMGMVDYNGLNTNEEKDRKYNNELKKLEIKWNDTKSKVIDDFLISQTKFVQAVFDQNNMKVIENIKGLIDNPESRVDPHFFDKTFSDEEKQKIEAKKKEIELIDNKMLELSELKKKTNNEVNQLHQSAVCSAILKLTGNQTTIVNDALNIPKESDSAMTLNY